MASYGGGVFKGVSGSSGGYLRRRYAISRAAIKRRLFTLDDAIFEQVIKAYLSAIGKKILHEARWNLLRGGYYSDLDTKIKDTPKHYALGALSASGGYSVEVVPRQKVASIEIYFKAPYAVNVEYGTAPAESSVTADQIYKRIINKNIADELLGKNKLRNEKDRQAKLHNIARKIAAHIRRNGIPPTFFLTRAFHRVIRELKSGHYKLIQKGRSFSFAKAGVVSGG